MIWSYFKLCSLSIQGSFPSDTQFSVCFLDNILKALAFLALRPFLDFITRTYKMIRWSPKAALVAYYFCQLFTMWVLSAFGLTFTNLL